MYYHYTKRFQYNSSDISFDRLSTDSFYIVLNGTISVLPLVHEDIVGGVRTTVTYPFKFADEFEFYSILDSDQPEVFDESSKELLFSMSLCKIKALKYGRYLSEVTIDDADPIKLVLKSLNVSDGHLVIPVGVSGSSIRYPVLSKKRDILTRIVGSLLSRENIELEDMVSGSYYIITQRSNAGIQVTAQDIYNRGSVVRSAVVLGFIPYSDSFNVYTFTAGQVSDMTSLLSNMGTRMDFIYNKITFCGDGVVSLVDSELDYEVMIPKLIQTDESVITYSSNIGVPMFRESPLDISNEYESTGDGLTQTPVLLGTASTYSISVFFSAVEGVRGAVISTGSEVDLSGRSFDDYLPPFLIPISSTAGYYTVVIVGSQKITGKYDLVSSTFGGVGEGGVSWTREVGGDNTDIHYTSVKVGARSFTDEVMEVMFI